MTYYTNRERRANPDESDLAEPLDWDGDLAEVAQKYCERMCDEGFFDHNDPKGHAMENRLQEDLRDDSNEFCSNHPKSD